MKFQAPPPSPSPPEEMRWKVTQNRDESAFLRSGKGLLDTLNNLLEREGRSFLDFDSILDFGCGCGRVARWLPEATRERAQLHGTDTDAEAIQWCSENIHEVKFHRNDEWPQLPFESESFDLVYAVSVFTHLDENHQFAWLKELRRITKPGGYWLLSWRYTHNIDRIGDDGLRVAVREGLAKDGFWFGSSNFWKGAFPAWYGGTYHTPDYIDRNWASEGVERLHTVEPGGWTTQYISLFRNGAPREARSVRHRRR